MEYIKTQQPGVETIALICKDNLKGFYAGALHVPGASVATCTCMCIPCLCECGATEALSCGKSLTG